MSFEAEVLIVYSGNKTQILVSCCMRTSFLCDVFISIIAFI
jgi:hypothetical protein